MIEREEEKPTDYTGLIIGVIALPVLLFFYHLGKYDIGLSVDICLGAVLFAIKIRWKLRKYFWFWAVIVLVSALHVPLILMARWPNGWMPGIALLPICLADIAIILGVIKFVEKFIVKVTPDEEGGWPTQPKP